MKLQNVSYLSLVDVDIVRGLLLKLYPQNLKWSSFYRHYLTKIQSLLGQGSNWSLLGKLSVVHGNRTKSLLYVQTMPNYFNAQSYLAHMLFLVK